MRQSLTNSVAPLAAGRIKRPAFFFAIPNEAGERRAASNSKWQLANSDLPQRTQRAQSKTKTIKTNSIEKNAPRTNTNLQFFNSCSFAKIRGYFLKWFANCYLPFA